MARHERASGPSALQQRFRRLVTAPEGVASALAEAGDATGASLEEWLVSDALLPATQRLEVYANAYFFRIRDALAEDYVALAAGLGEEGFHDLVTAYLCAHPPQRPSLRHAGERLADYLAHSPGAAPFRRRWPWAADLARLEWARADAFDAADAPVLDRTALAALPPERWSALRLYFDASVQLLRLDWPVQRAREATQRGAPFPSIDTPSPTVICVWRRRERVHDRALEPLEASLLDSARQGADFETLCGVAAASLGETEAPAYAAGCLERWLRDELLVGMDAAIPPDA